jgi:hypothetical protein
VRSAPGWQIDVPSSARKRRPAHRPAGTFACSAISAPTKSPSQAAALPSRSISDGSDKLASPAAAAHAQVSRSDIPQAPYASASRNSVSASFTPRARVKAPRARAVASKSNSAGKHDRTSGQ